MPEKEVSKGNGTPRPLTSLALCSFLFGSFMFMRMLCVLAEEMQESKPLMRLTSLNVEPLVVGGKASPQCASTT